jgi:alkylation response protein AidB-like acyl-CoA dehydrogenase
MGYTHEYPLHFYTRRAKAHQMWLGTPAVHRERVAAAMTE